MHMTFDKSVPVMEQRLRVMLAQSKRNHPKRHATQGDAKKLQRKKKNRVAFRLAVAYKERSRRLANARAYWRGEADELRP